MLRQYIFLIMIYAFISVINDYMLINFLNFSYIELDKVERYKIIGYIISPFLLLFSSHWYTNKNLLMFSLIAYLIVIMGIIYSFLGNYIILAFTSLGALEMAFIILLIMHIMLDRQITFRSAISNISIYGLIGYLTGMITVDICKTENISSHFIILLNIAVISIFMYLIYFNLYIIKNSTQKQPDFLAIVKNMELESISVFVIFYIIVAVLNSYEIHEITNNLLLISLGYEKYFMLITMLLLIIFSKKIFAINPYMVNSITITALAISLLLIAFWGKNMVLSLIFWLLVAMSLYVIFISNLIILSQKYHSKYLPAAFILYCFVGSLGFYAGDVTTDRLIFSMGEEGFLLSIKCAIITLSIYYFYRFKSDQLSNW